MYGMNNYGKLSADELIEWLPEAGFILSQCNISIYYKYAPYGSIVLYYIMLMSVSIGIHLRLLEDGLWIL